MSVSALKSMKANENVIERKCNFCLGSVFEVKLLFEGEGAFICATCVVTIAQTLAESIDDDE